MASLLNKNNNHSTVEALPSDNQLKATLNQLIRQADDNAQILQRFQQFELTLLNSDDIKTLLTSLLKTSRRHFQLDAVELLLYDPQTTLRELIPEPEAFPGLRLLSSNHNLVPLYDEAPKVRLCSTIGGQELPVFFSQNIGSVALLPLVRHGALVGSLHFGARDRLRFSEDKSVDFINHLASVAAVCFENAVNLERMHRLSMYDMLTQVKNRRAFHLALDNELSRAARSNRPLSLLFVDLDHFKQINDQHGHQVGDQALKTVAQHIQDMMRKTDHVCRYGGEEFALVLPDCGRERALEIAERIRQQVSELLIDNDNGGSLQLTLSVGVGVWQPRPGSRESGIGESLIKCSDLGVYQSKSAGRNCVHYVPLEMANIPTLKPEP